MKTKVVNLILIMIVLASTLIAMAFLPDIIPVHFDIHGEADRWGSKYELLILPAALALIWSIGDKSIGFLSKTVRVKDDEKLKSDALNNEKVLGKTLTVIYAIMAAVNLGIIYLTFSKLDNSTLPQVDVIKILVMLIGLLMIGLGNLMPKTRINGALGFRLPWTCYNDNTWRKSNLFAGSMGMIVGALIVAVGLIFEGLIAAVIMLALMVASTITMSVYAYLVYKKEKTNDLSEK
jgi:uncharacterized membrane protein